MRRIILFSVFTLGFLCASAQMNAKTFEDVLDKIEVNGKPLSENIKDAIKNNKEILGLIQKWNTKREKAEVKLAKAEELYNGAIAKVGDVANRFGEIKDKLTEVEEEYARCYSGKDDFGGLISKTYYKDKAGYEKFKYWLEKAINHANNYRKKAIKRSSIFAALKAGKQKVDLTGFGLADLEISIKDEAENIKGVAKTKARKQERLFSDRLDKLIGKKVGQETITKNIIDNVRRGSEKIPELNLLIKREKRLSRLEKLLNIIGKKLAIFEDKFEGVKLKIVEVLRYYREDLCGMKVLGIGVNPPYPSGSKEGQRKCRLWLSEALKHSMNVKISLSQYLENFEKQLKDLQASK